MRKRTKRKVWAKVNPIAYAIEGAAITPSEQLNQLRQKELSAIDALTRGKGSESDFYDILAMMMVCRCMAQAGIGPEALEACDRAEECLIADLARHQATGKVGTTGTGLQAYRDVYEYHDIQRQSVSRSEYEKHLRKAIKQVKFDKGEPQ